ncbi:hypothetical protein DENIS_0698 [Desulfonema ishimotonii]|uniref:Endonuclease/exonuclease/phosphatase domain-containing protein n=1 Tax=Desulfonema ishimotonii TaxID=45657 RepID=A0A401FS15_9BACT|nr:endonuclease/exonuclease/phosphatase family protein [Desulfonema ishimotonii]GBC59757.1 hypothetical protein DENIS_0698 [Desulfonema ishimotonii]
MLSVLTLNLRFGLAKDEGPRSWSRRKAIFPALFEKHPADFMGFQEANDFQADDLRQLLPDYDVIGQRRPAPVFWQNNLIFYRKSWKCTHADHFFLSPTPDIPSRFRDSRWPRQCTLGVFQQEKRKLICINTHFDFDAGVQCRSAAIIMKRLSRLPAEIPAILTGDFNAPPSAPCHAIFTGKAPEDECEISCFRDAFKAPFPATHHGFTGERVGDHIDWILFRGNMTLKTSGVFQSAIDGIWPSDHFPLYAVFDF